MFAVSAHTGEGIGPLLDAIVGLLPEGPAYYPEDMVTDHPERYIVGEFIREQLLAHTSDEVPYSVAVQVEQMQERPDGRFFIDAVIFVERDSQKGIIIGAKGERLKNIGRAARENIESLLDTKVFLNLWVKVRKNWRDNSAALNEFGYGDDES
jgi:GTP-binding protein Era